MAIRSPYKSYAASPLATDTYFLMQSKNTKPSEVNSSSSLTIQPMGVTDMPSAMRKMGWKRSAKFMERWLSSPAWKCPESWKDGTETPEGLYIPDEHCDDETITMSWLMAYSQAKNAREELINKRAFSNAGLKQTGRRLKALGWDGKGTYTFGRTNILGRPSMSAREVEQYYQNNYLAVGDK